MNVIHLKTFWGCLAIRNHCVKSPTSEWREQSMQRGPIRNVYSICQFDDYTVYLLYFLIVSRCSDGIDRHRVKWENAGCVRNSLSSVCLGEAIGNVTIWCNDAYKELYSQGNQGVFSGNFGTVKRPQKLNLELSFGNSIFSLYVERSKNDVAGLNSSRIEMIFQLENRELKK